MAQLRITLKPGVLAHARKQAENAGLSLSAYFTVLTLADTKDVGRQQRNRLEPDRRELLDLVERAEGRYGHTPAQEYCEGLVRSGSLSDVQKAMDEGLFLQWRYEKWRAAS